MKKYITIIILLIRLGNNCLAQLYDIDSLHQALETTQNDSVRVRCLIELSNNYKYSIPDSAIYYGNRAVNLAREINSPDDEIDAMAYIILSQIGLGNDSKALQITLQARKNAEIYNLAYGKGLCLNFLGVLNNNAKNHIQALTYFKEAKGVFDSIQNVTFSALMQVRIGETFSLLHQYDSALHYLQFAYDNELKYDWVNYYTVFALGKTYNQIGDIPKSLAYFRKSILLSHELYDVFNGNISIARIYHETGITDSTEYYALNAFSIAQESGFLSNIIEANEFLSNFYEKKNLQKAYEYNKTAMAYKDSLEALRSMTTFEGFQDLDEQQRRIELETARKEFQSRLRMNALLGSTFTLLVIAFVFYRNNRLKQKAKQKIESAYNQLKSTQSQLIQSEKMASLGELTAGIAHEIQNPLNFVNNFSEVNSELIDELEQEIQEGNMDEVKEIAKDIKENEKKIKHHGYRAEGIVKGMLQHSRTSHSEKEPTDLNVLAEEYLRLAYHGLRAKDKSFNADFKTNFDDSLPKINVIPQDIGRVLLNLINNAFYACTERSRSAGSDYQPLVIISTKRYDKSIEISVKDNGLGIPADIKNKIFQPFFTTKPTGSGTGLGLSLSYDIVKAHGGELKVESPLGNESGLGAEFILHLPF